MNGKKFHFSSLGMRILAQAHNLIVPVSQIVRTCDYIYAPQTDYI